MSSSSSCSSSSSSPSDSLLLWPEKLSRGPCTKATLEAGMKLFMVCKVCPAPDQFQAISDVPDMYPVICTSQYTHILKHSTMTIFLDNDPELLWIQVYQAASCIKCPETKVWSYRLRNSEAVSNCKPASKCHNFVLDYFRSIIARRKICLFVK